MESGRAAGPGPGFLVLRRLRKLASPALCFRTFGVAGFVAAAVTCAWVARFAGLPASFVPVMAVAAAASFFALALATKVASGDERLVYLRHHLVAVAALVVVAEAWHRPLLPVLDVSTVGIAIFLAVGRVGCTLAGCCHGRPCRVGIAYRREHAELGFPFWYVGIRLFPIALVEAAIVLALAAASIVVIRHQAAPGTATVLYAVGYGAARFGLELARGDATRPFLLGFSEAQWSAVVLTGATAALAWHHVVPGGPALAWAPVSLIAAGATLALVRALSAARGGLVLSPRDVRELAEALALLAARTNAGDADVALTANGVRISGGVVDDRGDHVHHYALSSAKGPLSTRAAERIAREIVRLRHQRCRCEILGGRRGVQHVLVCTPSNEARP